MGMSALLVAFAEEIGRNRALTADEIPVIARATQRSGLLKRWTEQEDQALRTLRANGATDRQIARELSRSLYAVRSRLRDHKVRKCERERRS